VNEQKKKNAMKKKITFGLVAASAVFMKSIAKDDLSAMIQANVDALAEFEWNGQSWNENSDHWFGERWLPSLKECVTTNWLGKPFYGKQVVCEIGAGNCFNGTDCTNS
jgi:hypothetical protein